MVDVSKLPSVSLSRDLKSHHTTCDECDGAGSYDDDGLVDCPGCDGEGKHYWPGHGLWSRQRRAMAMPPMLDRESSSGLWMRAVV